MANTYFRIKKEVEHNNIVNYEYNYTNNYDLSLTAFMSKQNIVQLTIQTQSTHRSQSGTGYIELNEEDIDNLIAGLLERKLKTISATGSEQSKFKPNYK